MKKAVVSARCTGQDGYGEDKAQNKCLCHWLNLHAQDFSRFKGVTQEMEDLNKVQGGC